MRRRKSAGLSLVELVMFIVIVGAAVAGIIGVITVTTRSSADPVIHKQALAIAEAVLEEVQLQPFTYCDPDDPSAATVNSSGAPIAFRASSNAAVVIGSGLNINRPGAVVDNDVMLLGFYLETTDPGAVATVTPGSWTFIDSIPNGTQFTMHVFYRRALAEPATYAISWNGISHSTTAEIVAYSGVIASGSPVDVYSKLANAASTSMTATGVTPVGTNDMLVFLGEHYTSALTATPPPGMVERNDTAYVYAAEQLLTSAAATGNQIATLSGSSQNSGFLVALKPTTSACLLEAIGPEPGETRYSTTLPFDNVNDYHGFDSNTAVPSGIRNIDSTLIAGLGGYRVTVSVAGQPLGAIGNDAYGYPQSLLITVTVTGPGNTTVTLNGYRTRYAPNDLP